MEKYGRIEGKKVSVYNTLPKHLDNILNFSNQTIEVINSKGFFKIITPAIQENERLLPIIPTDLENNKFNQRKEQIPEPTQEELSQRALENETARYIQRQQDGVQLYAQISAKFRLAKIQGQLPEEAHSAIENILRPVRDEVLAGQWMTAQELLEAIGSSVIGEATYNELHTRISEYIALNYEN